VMLTTWDIKMVCSGPKTELITHGLRWQRDIPFITSLEQRVISKLKPNLKSPILTYLNIRVDKKKRVKISTVISQKLCIIIGRNFSQYYYIMMSSFTVNYIKNKTRSQKLQCHTVHSPDAMAGKDTEWCSLWHQKKGHSFKMFKEEVTVSAGVCWKG
jgi:hypothetical protein